MTPQAVADVQIENLHVNDLQLDKLSATISSSGRLLRIESAEAVLDRQRVELAADIRRNSTDTEFDFVFRQAACCQPRPNAAGPGARGRLQIVSQRRCGIQESGACPARPAAYSSTAALTRKAPQIC